MNESPHNTPSVVGASCDDPLHLSHVEARAKTYSLNIPAKLELLSQLADMAYAARKSYRETPSGS